MTLRRALSLVLAPLAAFALGACSSSSGSSDTTNPGWNTSDAMFAQMMIPHHEQAIEMADLALDPSSGASSDVVALATAIKAAQDPEIAQMKSLLTGWGLSTSMDTSMDHSAMMSGMLSDADIEALDAKTGADFDRAWLEAMIDHHEGAIDMAEDVLKDGTNADFAALARAVVSTQQAEIDTMNRLLGN